MSKFAAISLEEYRSRVLSPNLSGWVFSAWADFGCFFLPFLVALAATQFKLFALDSNWLTVMIFSLFLDQGHVLATYVPVFGARGRLGRRILPFLIVGFTITFCFMSYSTQALWFMMIYGSFLHSTRQHFGWFKISARKIDPVASRGVQHFETLAFWNLILYPYIYIHSQNGPGITAYVFKQGLVKAFIPSSIDYLMRDLYWTILAAQVLWLGYRVVTQKERPWGHIAFLLATWIQFYVGLCVMKDFAFFSVAWLCCHGLSYHRFIFNGFIFKPESGPSNLMAKILGYTLLFSLFAYVIKHSYDFVGFDGLLQVQSVPTRILQSLIFSFTLSHYLWDSILWRRGGHPLLTVESVAVPSAKLESSNCSLSA